LIYKVGRLIEAPNDNVVKLSVAPTDRVPAIDDHSENLK
jgi:hypothetical protein